MLRHTVQLDTNINGNTYMFICDQNAPIEHVKEALAEIMSKVMAIEEKIMAANKQVSEAVPQEEKNE